MLAAGNPSVISTICNVHNVTIPGICPRRWIALKHSSEQRAMVVWDIVPTETITQICVIVNLDVCYHTCAAINHHTGVVLLLG